MRAAVQTRYGPPDVVSVREIDAPTPTDGEVLVRVRATTVNRTDCAVRAADPFVWRFIAGFRGPVQILKARGIRVTAVCAGADTGLVRDWARTRWSTT